MALFGNSLTVPSLDDILAQIGGQAPQAAPQPSLDGSGSPGFMQQLMAGLQGSGGLTPDQSGPSQTFDLSSLAPSQAPAAPPNQPAPDPTAGLPTPPQFTPMNPVLGVLDQVLLGGAVRGVQSAGFERQKQAYDLAMQRAALGRQLGAIQSLGDPRAQADATLNSEKFVAEDAKNFAQFNTPAGDTATMFGGQRQFTASKLVNNGALGTYGTQTPGGYTQTGAENVPQILAAGSVPNTFNAGQQGPGVAAQGAPGIVAPQGSAPQGIAPSVANAPRSIRNNNPGNLMSLTSGQTWNGQTGVDPNGYAVFGNQADGQAAAMKNIASYANRGIGTVARAIGRWAPQSAGNNTGAYASYVARQMGVGPQDQVNLSDPATANSFFNAVASYEAGPKARAALVAQGAPSPNQTPAAGAPVGWSGPPAKGYVQNADGTVTSPIGKPEAGPSFIGPSDIATIRDKVLGSTALEEAGQATSALNSLYNAITRYKGNNSVVDTAAVANLARTETGLSARQGMMDTVMNHYGVPDQVQNQFSKVFQNAPISVPALQNLTTMMKSYAASKRAIAQQRIDNESATYPKANLNLQLPKLNDEPAVQWYNGNQPSGNAAPASAQAGGDVLAQARAAIQRGAPRAAVIQRLQSLGVNPGQL